MWRSHEHLCQRCTARCIVQRGDELRQCHREVHEGGDHPRAGTLCPPREAVKPLSLGGSRTIARTHHHQQRAKQRFREARIQFDTASSQLQSQLSSKTDKPLELFSVRHHDTHRTRHTPATHKTHARHTHRPRCMAGSNVKVRCAGVHALSLRQAQVQPPPDRGLQPAVGRHRDEGVRRAGALRSVHASAARAPPRGL